MNVCILYCKYVIIIMWNNFVGIKFTSTTNEYRSLNVPVFDVFPSDLTFNNPFKHFSFF
jgi:hypothetical protein